MKRLKVLEIPRLKVLEIPPEGWCEMTPKEKKEALELVQEWLEGSKKSEEKEKEARNGEGY